MLKKILTVLALLSLAGTAYAVPVSWDKTGSILEPLRSSWTDQVRVPYLTATTTTATSTFTGGLKADLGVRFTAISNCTQALETDSVGSVICGTDATGGGGGSGNVATSTTEVTGQIAYWTSSGATPATLGTVATGTLSATGLLTVTASRYVIGGNAVISCDTCSVYPFVPTSHFGLTMSATSSNLFTTGVAGFYASGTSIFASTSVLGALNIGTLTATSGTSYINALNLGTALDISSYTNLTAGDGLTLTDDDVDCDTATGGVFGCLSAANWNTFNGKVGTSAVPVVGNLAYWTGAGIPPTLGTVATGSVSGTNGITVTAGRSAIGGALAIDCSVASASVVGCLATADWTTFNNKADLGSAMTGTFDGNNFAGGAVDLGDLLVGAGSGSLGELDIGTAGFVLMSSNGTAVWAATSSSASGVPNLVLTTISGTKYDTASTSGFSWHLDTGFISPASSTISGLLHLGTQVDWPVSATNTLVNNVPFAWSLATATNVSPILTVNSISGQDKFQVLDSRITTNNNVLFSISATGTLVVGNHIVSTSSDSGASPAVSSCGTGPTTVGTDTAGKITVGTGVVTSCTLTFNRTYEKAPACSLTNGTALAVSGTTNTSAITITSATSMDEDVIMYVCVGYK